MTAYLAPEEVTAVRQAAQQAGYADPSVRSVLMGGILPKYVGILPLLTAPALQLQSDLNLMNGVERLVDGTVPLERWLRNALDNTADAQAAEVFQRALDTVAMAASGEPSIEIDPTADEFAEAIVHRDDTVAYGFLRGGWEAGAAVAHVRVWPWTNGTAVRAARPHVGTGWLVAPRLLVTNHHVVNARTRQGQTTPTASESDLRRQGDGVLVRFGYDADGLGVEEARVDELVAWDERLDYAVLRLASDPARRPLSLARMPLVLQAGDRIPVNVIQHPLGGAKRVGLRNNLVYEADERDVKYFTDTRDGSSGSPVLTDDWLVVALHRAARAVRHVNFQGKTTAVVNVGTQMTTIMADLQARYPAVHAEILAQRAG